MNTTDTKTWADLRGENVIDSRDIIERMDELDGMFSADGMTDDEIAERNILRALCDEAGGYAPDWTYGETMILDSYFEDYARELAEDIGAIDPQAVWPLTYIDWPAAAEALKQDCTSIDVDGLTYWVR